MLRCVCLHFILLYHKNTVTCIFNFMLKYLNTKRGQNILYFLTFSLKSNYRSVKHVTLSLCRPFLLMLPPVKNTHPKKTLRPPDKEAP